PGHGRRRHRDNAGRDARLCRCVFDVTVAQIDATRGEQGPDGDRPIAEGPGTRIGPYKLLEKLGEGGMGSVYMAEQEEPVRRKLALKIIKLGMDSEQIVARSEARSLLGQKKYADAEPMLLSGYEGLESRHSKQDMAAGKIRLSDAGGRVVR